MATTTPGSSEAAPAPGEAKPPPDSGRQKIRSSLVLTAWFAASFCALVCATTLYHHFTATTNDPWKSPQLLALRERLVNEPANEQLKQEIRKLDADFRRKFRRRLLLDRSGGWLLLGGMLVFVMAAGNAAKFRPQPINILPPDPEADRKSARLASRSRLAVAGVTATVAVVSIVLIASCSKDILSEPGRSLGETSLAGGTNAALPTLAEFQANFPRFRGWDGSGVSTQTNAPLAWGPGTGAGIAWQVPILSPGHGSPIVWSNHVFISGGTTNLREVFAYDAADGKLRWRRAVENVPGSSPPPADLSDDTGFAAPTMATDGRLVFAMFVNGDLAALTFDGVVAWSKSLGPLKNMYGHAASLAIWPGMLVIQLDQGESKGGNSKLLAFETRTGRVLWQTSRPVPASWTSPIVVEAAGKPLILTLGLPWIIAYAGDNGSELWRAQLMDGEVVPSPVVAGGMLLAISPASKLLALRLDGAGEVTKSAVVWTNEDGVPDIASPVSNGQQVFTANGAGFLTCVDAKNGHKLWDHDLEMPVHASPAIVGGKLFVMGLQGAAVVADAGPQFKQIARSELPDKFVASPAFANGRTFLRGETNLYCIGPVAIPAAKAP